MYINTVKNDRKETKKPIVIYRKKIPIIDKKIPKRYPCRGDIIPIGMGLDDVLSIFASDLYSKA